jgi:hypothetical protein
MDAIGALSPEVILQDLSFGTQFQRVLLQLIKAPRPVLRDLGPFLL